MDNSPSEINELDKKYKPNQQNSTTFKHPSKKCWKCTNCHQEYIHPRFLKQHKAKEHKLKKYRCKNCNFETEIEEKFKSHFIEGKCPRKKRFKCQNCSFKSNIRFKVLKHEKFQCKIKKVHTCPFCKCKISNYKLFKKHLTIHRKYFSEVKSSSLKKHKNINKNTSDPNPIQCSHCQLSFSDLKQLKVHLNETLRKETLEDAEKNNSKENKHPKLGKSEDEALRIFKCQLCSFASKYIQDLKRHSTRIHGIEFFKTKKHLVLGTKKGYLCKKCYFVTEYFSNLKRHMMTIHNSASDGKVTVEHDTKYENIEIENKSFQKIHDILDWTFSEEENNENDGERCCEVITIEITEDVDENHDTKLMKNNNKCIDTSGKFIKKKNTKNLECLMCSETDCSYFSYSIKSFKEHMKSHENSIKIIYQCGKCELSISDKYMLKSHTNVHFLEENNPHFEQSFYTFKNNKYLGVKKIKPDKFINDLAQEDIFYHEYSKDKKPRGEQTYHKYAKGRKPRGEQTYKCQECGASLTKKLLDSHTNIHARKARKFLTEVTYFEYRNNKFICIFKLKANLSDEKFYKLGVPIYKCQLCGVLIFIRKTLETHTHLHAREEANPNLEVSFSELRNHIIVGTIIMRANNPMIQERPSLPRMHSPELNYDPNLPVFSCTECNYKTNEEKALAKHKNLHWTKDKERAYRAKKWLTCSLCFFHCFDTNTLKEHQEKHKKRPGINTNFMYPSF